MSESIGDSRLPRNPSRDNWGNDCTPTEASSGLPHHITACTCPEHHGVCDECGFKITVGPSGREYGHARRTNRDPKTARKRGDCEYRPRWCDPEKPQGGDYQRHPGGDSDD